MVNGGLWSIVYFVPGVKENQPNRTSLECHGKCQPLLDAVDFAVNEVDARADLRGSADPRQIQEG
jgi:hypothetical protein